MSEQKNNPDPESKYVSIPFSKEGLRKRNRTLSILRSMSVSLSLPLGVGELLNHALARVLEDFHLDAGRIYLMEEDCGHLFLAAHSGLEISGLERVALNEGFSGRAAATRSFIAQYVTDLEDQNRAKLLKSKGLEIVICVPLIALDRVVGVMNLATGKPFELDPDEIDLFYVVGSQIAAAIENALLYEDLQERLKQLDERNETIRLFAYSTAHDLRSPAIGIHGFAKRLKEKYGENLDDRGKRYCGEIVKLAEHMVTLLEEMNSYIATKELQPRLEVVRLQEITGLIRSEFAGRFRSRDIRLTEPELTPEMVVDKRALIRAISNLVDNALKYGGDNMREISIDYSRDKAFHILSVGDDGVGIGPEDREKIFDAFQRSQTSRGTMGSGLGLAIVKEAAKKHGGSVWVKSNAKGPIFYISIDRNLDVTA